MGSVYRSRAVFWLAFLFVVFLYLIHFTLQASKNPLRLDEVDYYQCMKNILRLGLPIYYAGEVNIPPDRLVYLSTRYLAGQEFVFWRFKPETGILKETFFALVNGTSRYTFGMWHPPLYIYLGSLAFRLFPLTPENSHLLRYFNLAFSAGIFLGVFVLSRELYMPKYRKVFLVALLLYTIHSLAVRGATLIDYNATLGPCVAVWFVIATLRSERKSCVSWELAGATTWALFTSLGIAVSLLYGLGIYCFLRLITGFRRNLVYVTLSVLLGITIFLISFWTFCQIQHLPFSQPFLHNIARTRVSFGNLTAIEHLINTLWKHLWWYSREIGLLNIGIWCILGAISIWKEPKLFHKHLLTNVIIATGLISQASLGANAYWFPKYILFVLPLLFLVIGGEGVSLIHTCSRKKGLYSALFLLLILLLILTNWFGSLYWLLRPGSTLYSPGEQGLLQASWTLQAATSSDEIILGRKDIAFFARRKFVEWTGRLASDVAFLQIRLRGTDTCYAVSSKFLVDSSTDMGVFIRNSFYVEDLIGDFVLLRCIERFR